MTRDGPEMGVYYALSDYAGISRRLFVELVDVLAASALLVLVLFVLSALFPGIQPTLDRTLLIFVAVWFIYFVGFKSSPLRTVGYRLGRVTLVSLQGEAPSFLRHCQRFLFAVLGPVNFVLDFLWLATDPARQAIRDKLAHTYVIKVGALPAGRGPIVYSNYHLLGWTFIFAEVRTSVRIHAR